MLPSDHDELLRGPISLLIASILLIINS